MPTAAEKPAWQRAIGAIIPPVLVAFIVLFGQDMLRRPVETERLAQLEKKVDALQVDMRDFIRRIERDFYAPRYQQSEDLIAPPSSPPPRPLPEPLLPRQSMLDRKRLIPDPIGMLNAWAWLVR